MNDYIIVNSSVANIYKSHTFTSELINQALIWEKLIVLSKKNNWYEIEQHDGYIGWIHEFYITDSNVHDSDILLQDQNNWYWVKDRFTSLRFMDSSELLISFGSSLPCFQHKDDFFTKLPNGKKGIININSLIKCNLNHTLENIINYSIKLIGCPYLWGGRSSYGYDCSGLIQSIYSAIGHKLPRDCSIQIKSNLLFQINKKNINKGDLIYFNENGLINHVGIFINKKQFLHSSGQVMLNSIDKNDIDFNCKLYNMVYGFYRIK